MQMKLEWVGLDDAIFYGESQPEHPLFHLKSSYLYSIKNITCREN
jgi:hypothetical protein